MKDTKRALRRHHRQRMIARARRIFTFRGHSGEDLERRARLNYDHLQRCSCWMCGHRRKWNGSTVQELRWNQKSKEEDE